MTETFVYESYYIAFYHILSLFLLVFINVVIYLKTVKSQLLSSFFVLQGILALWIVSKILNRRRPSHAENTQIPKMLLQGVQGWLRWLSHRCCSTIF